MMSNASTPSYTCLLRLYLLWRAINLNLCLTTGMTAYGKSHLFSIVIKSWSRDQDKVFLSGGDIAPALL